MKSGFTFILRSYIGKIFLNSTNYLMIAIGYLVISIIFKGLFDSYLTNDSGLSKTVLAPYFNSLNVILSFLFVFKMAEYLFEPLEASNKHIIDQFKINKTSILLAQFFTSLIFGLKILFPGFILLLFIEFIGMRTNAEIYFPLLSIFFFQIFIFSWMSLFNNIFKRKLITILLSFLIVSLFSFLSSYSDIARNLFISNFLSELSFVSHSEMIYRGVLRTKDIVYFLSWPVVSILFQYIFLESEKKIYEKKVKPLKYMSASLLVLLTFMINFIAHKKNVSLDFTESLKFSLSTQSKRELTAIKDSVKVYAFGLSRDLKKVRHLLERYREHNREIEIYYIDPDLRPDLISKYQIYRVPSIVLNGHKSKTISLINEHNVTAGLIDVSRLNKKKILIYNDKFSEKDRLSVFIKKMKNNYYEVNWVTELSNINSNDFLVYIAHYDLNDSIKNLLNEYVKLGGHLFLFLPPNIHSPFVSWQKFISKYGINYFTHLVVDYDQMIKGSKGTVPFVLNPYLYDDTQFQGKIIFPLAATFTPNDKAAPDSIVRILSESSSKKGKSWGESNVNEIKVKARYNENLDIQGPLALILDSNSREGKSSSGNVTIFASNAFLNDEYSNISDNVKYFESLVSSKESVFVSQTVTQNLAAVFKKKQANRIEKYLYLVFLIPFFYLIGFTVLRKKYD